MDFYQIICFLLNIPTEEHAGDWGRIEDLLTISRGFSLPPVSLLSFLLCLMLTQFMRLL